MDSEREKHVTIVKSSSFLRSFDHDFECSVFSRCTAGRLPVREGVPDRVQRGETGILCKRKRPQRSELCWNRGSEFGATPSPATCGNGCHERCHRAPAG